MTTRPVDLEKLLRVPHVDNYYGFDISPDGSRLAFSWNPTGNWEIYFLNLGETGPFERITDGPGAKLAPRWSSQGTLAYLVDLDGGENFDIYVFDPESGSHTNLTPHTDEAIQPEYCWSPDGLLIAFCSNRTGLFSPFIMSAAGGAARQMHDLPLHAVSVEWSGDGRWLAVSYETGAQDYETWILSLHREHPRPIAVSGKTINAIGSRWAPEGAKAAFASDATGSFEIGLYEPESQELTWVTSGKGDKRSPRWSPDGQRLVYQVRTGTQTFLEVLDLRSGSKEKLQPEPGICDLPVFTLDGESLVFLFENPRHPPDLWQTALAQPSLHQLTQSIPPEFLDAQFRLPEEIEYPSQDGERIPALLYTPERRRMGKGEPGAKPGVLLIHGGPNWLSEMSWDPLIQYMVCRGWTVLAPNYRGSIGYGRRWQLANRFDLGGNDARDVAAGADYLVREELADPGKIAVTGRSYGGYLTMVSLTQTPDLWAAGSAVVPFLNWFTGHENSREDLQHWDLENFGDPDKDRERYYERSPYFYLDQVAAPVQLVCGANDPRCPASESSAAHQILIALGKPCDLVLFEDEGHRFLKTENRVRAEMRRAEFLVQALQA